VGAVQVQRLDETAVLHYVPVAVAVDAAVDVDDVAAAAAVVAAADIDVGQ
jgi:hypothetical protein